MSTKVHDLYRYTRGDILELLGELQDLRAQYRAYLQGNFRQLAPINKGSKIIDHGRLYNMVKSHTSIGARSIFNIDASVCIYLHEGHVYTHFFVDQAFLHPAIEHNAHFVDLSYDGRSDKPDDVSLTDWQARYDLIDAIGILNMAPSRVGFVFILADEHDAYELVYKM